MKLIPQKFGWEILLSNQWVKEGNNRKIRKYFDMNILRKIRIYFEINSYLGKEHRISCIESQNLYQGHTCFYTY